MLVFSRRCSYVFGNEHTSINIIIQCHVRKALTVSVKLVLKSFPKIVLLKALFLTSLLSAFVG